MPDEITFDEVAPVIPVRDLEAALARYRQLGGGPADRAGQHALRPA